MNQRVVVELTPHIIYLLHGLDSTRLFQCVVPLIMFHDKNEIKTYYCSRRKYTRISIQAELLSS